MGDDRKKLLKGLPERLASSSDCIQQDTCKTVVQLWKNFEDLYFNYISSWVPFATDVYRKKIKEWIDSFSTLGEKRTGYRKEKVTCYMHAAAYHIPQMVERNQNIKQFSGQGVEKNNDDARRIVQRKSNHNDDPAEVLRTEHRLGVLHHLQRKHRTYTKRAAEYWDEIIKTKRGKKQGISYSKKRTSTPQTQESITTKAKQKKVNKKSLKKERRNKEMLHRHIYKVKITNKFKYTYLLVSINDTIKLKLN
ncbi:hypothetical protein OS493_002481 [Desmophyllum pertusum]|uniref:Uncharacterized protein n=1 Tax=Desmophyllum pertusum TaxID=174260 RepID=A0A9W9YUG6_9CNID|nr:hypothetical protein OS493_002481 [Desmophyllum pertusum]